MSGAMLLTVWMVGLLAAAAAVDIRQRRIPNWLSLSLILSGVAASLTPYAPVGVGASLLGLAGAFVAGLVLLAMGGLGGGDVKLLAGVGAWIGPIGVLLVFAVSAVLGLAITLTWAMRRGQMRSLAGNSLAMVGQLMRHRSLDESERPFESVGRPLPYAVPVAAATAMILIAGRMSWL